MSNLTFRFSVSFFANVARSGFSFLTAVLLARALGPIDFGRMAFLLATFTAVCALIDLGSSSAFFTMLSRRVRSRQFISLYWKFIGLQFVSGLFLLLLILPDSLITLIWAGESRFLVALAFMAAFMQSTVWNLAIQMAEASRQTIIAQKINVSVVLVHLLVVLILSFSSQLSISLVFIAVAMEWAVASWLCSRLYSIHKSFDPIKTEETQTTKSVFMEFLFYCSPLLPVIIIGFLQDFADRWMLQAWAGAEQQAFFSVSQQFSAVALIATASILRLVWKEIAEAHERQDLKRVHLLYQRSSRLLFFVGAFFVGALIPLAPEILGLLFGQSYLSGATTLSIMLFYPVHQSIGQINGMMMLATGKTKEYSIASSLSILVSLLVLYFMLAPASMTIPGFELGSQGLAMKQVGVQVFSVNLLGWIIARIFGWKFEWLYQLFSLLGCLIFGLFAFVVSSEVVGETGFWFLKFSLMGLIYITLIICYLYCFPQLLSLSREELKERLIGLMLLGRVK